MTKRKFECWQCHRRFEADDQNWVECPNCHSDNVDYAHFHMPKGWWKWGVGIAACVAVVCVLFNINWGAFKKVESPYIPSDTDTIVPSPYHPEVTDTVEIKEIIHLEKTPEVIINGSPVFKDGGYSFTVIVKNAPPQGTFYVVALDHFDHSQIVACSDDGRFSGLKPSENDGQYDFGVCAVANDSLLCEPVPRAGFMLQQAVAQRMSKEDLQELIDSDDDSLAGDKNPQIAPNCKLITTGLPSDEQAPAYLPDVAEMVAMGQPVTITKVEYDNMNRISTVHVTVTPKE